MRLADLTPLQMALGVSVLVHAAVLGVRVADPAAFDRVLQESPLEIILVNARSSQTDLPAKPAALAQATLAGGGDLERGRATSPLPPSAFRAVGDSDQDAQRRIEALQEQQQMLLARVRKQLAALPAPDPSRTGQTADSTAQEERRRQLLDLLAEIERRVNEENARPKRRYISPSTREVAYAGYVDALRRRIEARGTLNFPEARGQKLYGQLTLLITVNHDGRLLATELVESSGNADLDRRAQAIVRSLGNFGTFTDAMRRQADQIVLPSRFRFTRDETLETQVSATPQ
ncbi:protein TonB [Pseudacidovorax sp. 1753]|uniref:energy transducer TonB n=1 Tax=unclassified Pseudacidovorax TaxID=2620592 RepID=UPI001B7C5153|nr:TonB family protein [Pseudacidovorax sp.]MBP6896459.1 TonB family protein [Pseudacidovorax sp.]